MELDTTLPTAHVHLLRHRMKDINSVLNPKKQV